MENMKEVLKKAFYVWAASYKFFAPEDVEFTIAVWARAFRGISPAAVSAAAEEWVARSNKEPTPADIRELALLFENRHQRVLPEVAWEELVKAAQQGLTLQQVSKRFRKYPRVVQAIRSVGWDRVRMADTIKEIPFVRRDFLNAYENITDFVKEQEVITDAGRKVLIGAFNAAKAKKEQLPQ